MTNNKEQIKKLELENCELRRLLFLRHGCSGPALYGDDGEMQCNHCLLDFKRDSPNEMHSNWTRIMLDQPPQWNWSRRIKK